MRAAAWKRESRGGNKMSQERRGKGEVVQSRRAGGHRQGTRDLKNEGGGLETRGPRVWIGELRMIQYIDQ